MVYAILICWHLAVTVHIAVVYVIQICWQLAVTVHTAMVYVIQVSLIACCHCMTYTIAVCRVKNSWWWTSNWPKHVEFYSKNKFEKLVHLVGFIIRITKAIDTHTHTHRICNTYCFSVTPMVTSLLPLCVYCLSYCGFRQSFNLARNNVREL